MTSQPRVSRSLEDFDAIDSAPPIVGKLRVPTPRPLDRLRHAKGVGISDGLSGGHGRMFCGHSLPIIKTGNIYIYIYIPRFGLFRLITP
jgi:hypothetical protein